MLHVVKTSVIVAKEESFCAMVFRGFANEQLNPDQSIYELIIRQVIYMVTIESSPNHSWLICVLK